MQYAIRGKCMTESSKKRITNSGDLINRYDTRLHIAYKVTRDVNHMSEALCRDVIETVYGSIAKKGKR